MLCWAILLFLNGSQNSENFKLVKWLSMLPRWIHAYTFVKSINYWMEVEQLSQAYWSQSETSGYQQMSISRQGKMNNDKPSNQ